MQIYAAESRHLCIYSQRQSSCKTTDYIQASIDDIADNLENASINSSFVRESLDIFILFDQIYIRILELHSILNN